MELVLILIGMFLLIIGVMGCIIPAIPGPPVAYLALILSLFIDQSLNTISENNYILLTILGILTLSITVIDFLLPVWGAKKFGGTSSGRKGSTIALIIGVVNPLATAGFGALLIVISPPIGAFIGEKVAGGSTQTAIKSAKGSFIGFLSGLFLKLALVIAMAVYFLYLLF